MSTSPGEIIAAVTISVVTFLLVLVFVRSLCQELLTSRENAATTQAAVAAAALAARPPEPQAAGYRDNDEDLEARGHSDALEEHSRQRRADPTAGLPSFTYNPSSSLMTKHNVTSTSGGGEETCPVCLGAFQVGETVRLLPVCLHLYHIECIDPWLNVHTTCPICRSGIDSPMDGSMLLPPV
ncbi:hypothetical protein PR202_ga15242 [Eleusine coracana subsp. coracana]|uniref:RING-type E3 ubiquitin transferase n=1 Tax=Eleusine coracana subsp. coracana TaxID=191504 RepID=A0AAV5CJQ4_ELECO|nr:hypothetical protein QOZ80_6BG0495280 [Eleusine coracana subsp. coracana]GJM98252.1 hypothetical protein PR202_ga15242 [Eleusine coracana subsp. coracana]